MNSQHDMGGAEEGRMESVNALPLFLIACHAHVFMCFSVSITAQERELEGCKTVLVTSQHALSQIALVGAIAVGKIHRNLASTAAYICCAAVRVTPR